MAAALESWEKVGACYATPGYRNVINQLSEQYCQCMVNPNVIKYYSI